MCAGRCATLLMSFKRLHARLQLSAALSSANKQAVLAMMRRHVRNTASVVQTSTCPTAATVHVRAAPLSAARTNRPCSGACGAQARSQHCQHHSDELSDIYMPDCSDSSSARTNRPCSDAQARSQHCRRHSDELSNVYMRDCSDSSAQLQRCPIAATALQELCANKQAAQ